MRLYMLDTAARRSAQAFSLGSSRARSGGSQALRPTSYALTPMFPRLDGLDFQAGIRCLERSYGHAIGSEGRVAGVHSTSQSSRK